MMKKIAALFMMLLLVACGKTETKNTNLALPEGVHRIIIKEHIKAAGYIYLRADDNGEEKWLAILEMPVQDGDTFYYSDAIEMKNFKSKTLNKTFESIIFVNSISKNKNGDKTNKDISNDEQYNKNENNKNIDVNIKPLINGKTIEMIFRNKKALKNKTIKLRGVVVKYNSDILDKNWIHIQDGTSYKEQGDILVTSKDKAHVGDTVMVEGTLVLDKDFGAGYFYKVLIENAKVVIE